MIIGEIERGETEVLRISTEEYKGRKYIDVRIYFENDDGEWKPTKKGITVQPGAARRLHGPGQKSRGGLIAALRGGAMADECPFCQIVAGKREADIVYANETLVVFRDLHPHAPVHLLIVPRKHIRSMNELAPEDKDIVGEMLMKAPEMRKAHVG